MTASQLSVNSESCDAVSGVGGLTLVTRSNRARSIVTATRCASASKNCALSWLDGSVGSVDDGRDRNEAGFPLEPPPGGASFRILSLPPPQPGVHDDENWLRVPGDDPLRPGMHATDTLDYVIVIEGEVVL